MAFDQTTRNRLNRFVADSRGVLATEFTRQLQATYGMNPATGDVADINSLAGLTPHQQETAQLLRDTFEHYLAANDHAKGKSKEKESRLSALDRIVREQAFTVLNRLAALRMSEARGFLTESLANGYDSKGFQLFHRIAGTSLGETGEAYTHYLFSIFDEFALDLSVLFDRFATQGRLFPSAPILQELLALINDDEVAPLWREDETIGWIYQYFNSQEERKKMRDASQAPRNSRELAVRNQFFTPRYVVEFLTDNTLGRIWYEMTKGQTKLIDECEYLVKRPNEIFLSEGEQAPELNSTEDLSQDELLQQTVYIEHRALKDPRDIKMLDPACGSMHFGLYCFDLFERIYEEAWDLELAQGADCFARENNQESLTQSYSGKAEFLTHVPRLIIENNIHGVDIDPRAAQVAGMSLWQRAHNSWQKAGVKPQIRPQITKSNIVCAEPMPGEKELLQEFSSQLKPTVLGQLVEVIFEKMQLAGEAGTLLKIEKEIEDAIAGAKTVWQQQNQALSQFPDLAKVAKQQSEGKGEVDFDVSDIDDEDFWHQAEQKILDALAQYSSSTSADMTEQKRLFASDAAKGFAFIDLCKKRFDVVLMNPPFGDPSKRIKKYLSDNYIGQPNDLYSCFIERSVSRMCTGLSGYVTPREFITYSSFKNLRSKVINPLSRIEIFSDFGLGVMDEAMVRASAYVLNSSKDKTGVATPFFRFVGKKYSDKELLSLCKCINQSKVEDRIYFASQDSFTEVGEGSIAYWVNPKTIKRFSGELFENKAGDAKLGVQTANNPQFLRLSCELSSQLENISDWRPYLKGGEFQKYYNNIHMCINWKKDGSHIQDSYGASVRLRDISQYEKTGLNYPLINENGINVGLLPLKAVFDNGSPSIYPHEDSQIFSILGLINSRFAELCFRCLTSTRHWQVGYLRKIPWVDIPNEFNPKIKELAQKAANLQKLLTSEDELSIDYSGPLLIENLESGEAISLKKAIKEKVDRELKIQCEIIGIDYELDSLANLIFKVSDDEKKTMLDVVGIHPLEIENYTIDSFLEKRNHRVSLFKIENLAWKINKTPESIRTDESLAFTLIDYKLETEKLLSYLVGEVFGRWNKKDDSFNFPSTLIGEKVIKNIIPNKSDIAFYFDNSSLVKAINGKLETYAITTQECVETLSCSIGSYFLLNTNFFNYHLKSNTKSQRQAPVYWPLQLSPKGYAVWLYFHRLNTQTLIQLTNDLVEPKIKQVSIEIESLRDLGKQDKKSLLELDKLIDKKLELEAIRDELVRISRFWVPQQEDGVQITAAPLWRLFQHKAWQKKLKQTWEKLEEGEYDWAHLAFSTWPERVLKKCHEDRSLAIAHDVEADLWHEVEVIKGRKKEHVWEWQPKPLSDAELHAYIREKIATDERLKLYRSNQSANANGGVL